MNRLNIIQALMRQKGLKNYLEIGVENGHIFFRIKSTFKVAVDPKFIFDAGRRFGKAILNPYNLNNQYFEKASDDFFAQDAKRVFSGKKLQLALIDGMHDCNPKTVGAAGRFEGWEVGEWNGDVW